MKFVEGRITEKEINEVFADAYEAEKNLGTTSTVAHMVIDLQRLNLLYDNFKTEETKRVRT